MIATSVSIADASETVAQCWTNFDPFMHNDEECSNMLPKFCSENTARILKYFLPSFNCYAWKGHSSQTLCWDFDLKTRWVLYLKQVAEN